MKSFKRQPSSFKEPSSLNLPETVVALSEAKGLFCSKALRQRFFSRDCGIRMTKTEGWVGYWKFEVSLKFGVWSLEFIA
jgi:hypothetical protein